MNTLATIALIWIVASILFSLFWGKFVEMSNK